MRNRTRPVAAGISRLWIYAPAAALVLAAAYATLGPGTARETPDAAQAGDAAPSVRRPIPAPKPNVAAKGHHAAATQLAPGAAEMGPASWYDFGPNETANGETMNAGALTAAHPSLPLGTRVLVENVENGQTVVVRINDRGPLSGESIIDLSKAAATRLDMIKGGAATVRVRRVNDTLASRHGRIDIIE